MRGGQNAMPWVHQKDLTLRCRYAAGYSERCVFSRSGNPKRWPDFFGKKKWATCSDRASSVTLHFLALSRMAFRFDLGVLSMRRNMVYLPKIQLVSLDPERNPAAIVSRWSKFASERDEHIFGGWSYAFSWYVIVLDSTVNWSKQTLLAGWSGTDNVVLLPCRKFSWERSKRLGPDGLVEVLDGSQTLKLMESFRSFSFGLRSRDKSSRFPRGTACIRAAGDGALLVLWLSWFSTLKKGSNYLP